MPDDRGKRRLPCNNCKERHSKCDLGRPCTSCKKANLHCVDNSPFRFKAATQSKGELEFASDQTWLKPRVRGGLSFVNETIHSPRTSYDTTCKRRRTDSSVGALHEPSESPHSESSRRHAFPTTGEALSGPESCTPVGIFPEASHPGIGNFTEAAHPSKDHALHDTGFRTQFSARSRPLETESSYSSSLSLPSLPRPSCLMRHFVENLVDPFDCTDKDKHFAYVVPQRAMTCPVLFYAICTASAGHLVRHCSKQWPNRTPIFDNITLSDLTEKSVAEYHNSCISLFISLSNDPACNYDENVFAAATILRFYEQLGVDFFGLDSEIYLGVVRAVVLSQPDYTFGSFDDDYPPPRTADVINLPFTSLGYSVCLVALRQEIWSVLINRRPFRLFRRTGKSYNPPEPAGDFEWSNHIIFWCADVLRFCFGDEGGLPIDDRFPQDRLGQWEFLDGFKRNWETMRPDSFQPLYYREADPENGRHFPQIVHMNDCQVLGLQHFEIACILLEVYHPQRLPIGPGATARNLAIDELARQRTLRVCGLALSNKKSQATLVTAAIVMTMCGETFTDPATQQVLLDVLTYIGREHAWPSQSVLLNLQNGWELRKKSH
ncbi:hypothetical protein ASPCAL06170 [Aspergillus calidoustus]|uniref:Zn(2)-C6 fungal-type domain-containing protein n=1 Tax=Aspergillus calidoustus TaxID=454130 RepID=A0A0U5G3X2_ASPCI|nr:hypothetical protein ASPCAL06170 [Aspergillus calidoustus]